jgi:hypothetical protein
MRGQTEGGLAARSGGWAQSTGWAGLAYECWQLGKACWKGLRAKREARRGSLSVVTRLDLGPKRSLVVVACGRRRFLVGMGGEGITAMVEIGPAPVPGRVRSLDRSGCRPAMMGRMRRSGRSAVVRRRGSSSSPALEIGR